MPRDLSGLITLNLEVNGIPVRLGTELDDETWRKAIDTGVFIPVGFFGKLAMGAGLSGGAAYTAKNRELQMFGGKMFFAPDLGDGPLKFGTSVSAFFRNDSLYRLRVGVSGNRKSANHFARQCAHALTRQLGEPNQRTKDGAHVWWGKSDRLTLFHARDKYFIHELNPGRK
ncbi:hypothetical protein JXD38_09855 [candidate division WOR-3 bacterium]|nr:hypothetical protein [candidate division WOR-3 bacterium]